ncbi:mucin-5AC-like isoform X2, partial [Clarias magur]
RTELELIDGKITEMEAATSLPINLNVRNVGLYLVIESDIGLTVLWDRKTTVRIILQPQHMENETFVICNCTLARCIEDYTVEIIPYECPPLQNITCFNGKPPVQVPDKYHCCKEHACDCFCEGWGDPHYKTFDGLFYSYQGECTYVLMEEISPKHNLKIYIVNAKCDPRESVSCPRAIIVSYNNLVITLKNHNLIGAAKLEALMEHSALNLPFYQSGVRVVSSQLNLILDIPQLRVVVMFGVTGFSVNLPFQHFGNNTQGHCGTCNNNQADDCMLPGGEIVKDCAVMANYWKAKSLYNTECKLAPPPEPAKTLCVINPVCELLKSDLFKECHPHLPPDNYISGCQFDSCHMSNPAVVCSSLQTYAIACSQLGICINWRDQTDLCPVECPADKVYQACGPAHPPTCNDKHQDHFLNSTTEGCFCPDGMQLFSKESKQCVDKCGCLDPSGKGRELGEQFQYGCQDCVCDQTSARITCKPKQCSNNNQVTCSDPGFIVANVTNPSDACCTILTCRCESSTCPSINDQCPVGYTPVLKVPEGKCCPELACDPKKVCVHNGLEYKPGTSIPVFNCQECHCTWIIDPRTRLYKVKCGLIPCNEECEPGYVYVESDTTECCGKCVKNKCVIKHNGTVNILESGTEWTPTHDACNKFMCTVIDGQYVTTNYKIHCPPFNIDYCQPGTVQLSANRCCRVCVEKEKGCKVQSTFDYITHNNCRSKTKIEQTHCQGHCNSYSKHLQFINAIMFIMFFLASSVPHTTGLMKTTMIPVPMQTKMEMIVGSTRGAAHNGQICSTWGNFHFSTFDGDFFQLPYACNYILTTMCDSTNSDFNIQLRREYKDNLPAISSFTINLEGVPIILHQGNITLNDEVLTIPGYYNGIRIEKTTNYIKISSKIGLTVFWDEANSLSIEISTNYRNKTCGLCGDFNGILQNEFIENGQLLNPDQIGLKWKMNAPTETCEQTPLKPEEECLIKANICEKLLHAPAFESCHNLLPMNVYLEACSKDLCQCNSSQNICICDTISEFSRQCAHAGGSPGNWRSNDFCGISCPLNMIHSECGNPCIDTCSNQEGTRVCGGHCVDECVCPPGTVLNDIENNGCVPVAECPCTHNGENYQPGESFTRTRQTCVCSNGRWNCSNQNCPGTCSLLGGSHIITYDSKTYSFNGNCDYILSKDNNNNITVVANLAQCGSTQSQTCLTSVKLTTSTNPVTISSSGNVFINNVATNLPIRTGNMTIFRPSPYYIIAHTPSLKIVTQLSPVMQVYTQASPAQKGTLSGLCGNFNDMQGDDFKTHSGLIEGTSTSFASSWKVKLCQDFSATLSDPCSMSVEKEKYAKQWCEMLSDPAGVFSPCHFELNPKDYVMRCKYDACNCAQSEDCMCAAVSSYVYACAERGVMIKDWRNNMCDTYKNNCPGNMEYSYNQTSCRKTCRSLGENDYICDLSFTPVDGCGCPEDTYLNDRDECVPASDCPCYINNELWAPGQITSQLGSTCTCSDGVLQCTGLDEVTTCTEPMVYFNCSDAEPGKKGTECQNSCQIPTDSIQCTSTQCKSGCVCPGTLLADGQGGCVKEEQCPCVHNGVFYQPEDTIKADCNNCTCKNRKWICTQKECHKMCTIYGDSHYNTFDGRRFTFNGNCEYTLAQDYCGDSNSGSFRIITENIPCGTTGTTCSKSIKIFIGNKQLLLSEENIKSVQYYNGTEIPYEIHSVGIYMVIEAKNNLTVFWDKKTSLMVKLGPSFKGTVCGLCGNYDGDWNNDFMTRGGEGVADPAEFGNSWRISTTCPEASGILSPCDMRPYRQAWAMKQCSILKSDVFSTCHSVVDPAQYYDACVRDTCACDAGGDCECFCTAVAAYAAACSGQGVCILWRSPTICPLFCDYYNNHEGCEWHYKPCGQSCMKTCKNPSGVCYSEIPPLEGCFPQCPSDRPYLEEATMKCVAREECGCYDDENNIHYNVGDTIPTTKNCMECICTTIGPSCTYIESACYCEYNGQTYTTGQLIYSTTDGDGTCIIASCGQNGTVVRNMTLCSSTAPPTTTIFNFTSTTLTPETTTIEKPGPTSLPKVTTGSSVITEVTSTKPFTTITHILMTSSTLFPKTTTIVGTSKPPTTAITTALPSTPTETSYTTSVERPTSTSTMLPTTTKSTLIPQTTTSTVIPSTTTEIISEAPVRTASTTTTAPVSSTMLPTTTKSTLIPQTTTETGSTPTVVTQSTTTLPVSSTNLPTITKSTVISPTTAETISETTFSVITVSTVAPTKGQQHFSTESTIPTTTETISKTTVGTASTTTSPVSSTMLPPTTKSIVVTQTTTETGSTPTVETPSTTTSPGSSTTGPTTTKSTLIPSTPTEIISETTPGTASTFTTAPVPSTTMPTTTLSIIQTTSKGTTSSMITTSTMTFTTGPHSTTGGPCFCKYMDQIFYQGSVIYNQTDGTGWCFTAYCDRMCHLIKTSGPCYSISTPPPSKTPTMPSSSTKPITTTPHIPKDCTYLDPPRKNGDSWQGKCYENKCIDGSIMSTPVNCTDSALPMPVCENGIPPIKVYDKTGCCFHYECQ